jgi:hypothetical protein
MGFEPTMAVFEQAKTVHALEHCDRPQKNRLVIILYSIIVSLVTTWEVTFVTKVAVVLKKKKKVKLSLYRAMEAHRVVKR